MAEEPLRTAMGVWSKLKKCVLIERISAARDHLFSLSFHMPVMK